MTAKMLCCLLVAPATLVAAGLTATHEVRTHNTPRTFTVAPSRGEWEARARDIRQQVLVSCGLWPLPERTPLRARVFDRIERDGYTVEKVVFESWPGFYVCGNLYRPRGQGPGPFPAVLNPHGHWADGRLTDGPDGSVQARCVNFARRGMIALAYDMVGYNDTRFANHPAAGQPGAEFHKRHRRFATNAVCQLWGISLMGLQTWNSIRALDLLESLPDVDKARLACTGASGGGTQTFILGAVDDRVAVLAPVCMVSHTMQGGCLCENAPGLRVKYSNMDIAAAAAPRPQLLVAATGDWTKDTPAVEGPAVASVYRLFDAAERMRYVRFEAGHNYNRTSREAVYAWFERWLLGRPDATASPELPYSKESGDQLRVWVDEKLPADALTDEQLSDRLKTQHRAHLNALLPRRRSDLAAFRDTFEPMWRHTLQVDWPIPAARVTVQPLRRGADFVAAEFRVDLEDGGTTVSAVHLQPARSAVSRSVPPRLVLLVHEDGAAKYCDPGGAPQGLAKGLLAEGCGVLLIRQFSPTPDVSPLADFYSTYNRTLLQQRVRDVLAVCGSVAKLAPGSRTRPRLVLHGEGPAGLWALLAAPAADAVVADATAWDPDQDEALLSPRLFCPGYRALGGVATAALLAAPHPLWLHTTGERFDSAPLRNGYQAHNALRKLRLQTQPATMEALLRGIPRL